MKRKNVAVKNKVKKNKIIKDSALDLLSVFFSPIKEPSIEELKNQNLFYQALDVLDILVTKGADPERIEVERDVIKDLIKEENN